VPGAAVRQGADQRAFVLETIAQRTLQAGKIFVQPTGWPRKGMSSAKWMTMEML